METKQNLLLYSNLQKFFTVSKYKEILEEIQNYPVNTLEIHIEIKCSSRRAKTLEKIISLTSTVDYYKIDSDKELLYLKLNGIKKVLIKDLQTLKQTLIQFS